MFPSPIEAQAGLQENINDEKVVSELARTKIRNEIAAVLWNMKMVTETFKYSYCYATEKTLTEVAQELVRLGFRVDLCLFDDYLRLKVSIC